MGAKADVLIAGAGPVGLTLAAELSRYGVPVRIVEKNAQRTDKSKALVVWSRTLELMDRMGCSENFLATGMKCTAANISSGRESIARITFEDAATPYPFALMIPQTETERLLEEFLNRLGVEVERGVELTEFADSGDHVVSKLHHPDGSDEVVETSWLAGCDGAHSLVRKQLGVDFKGSTQPSDWMLGDVHISGVPAADEIHAYWHSDGVLIIFPITPGRYRVVADEGMTDVDHPRADPTLEELQAVLDQRGPGGMKVSDPIWLATFHINERKVANYQSGRVFLAGDAAHIHSPAGGQGMNTGIQDACNLGWKLACVCHGQCRESPVLESYSPERSGVGDLVLKAAGRFTDVAVLKGPVKQAIRNHLASFVLGLGSFRRLAVATMEELSIAYPESPLNGSGGHKGLHPLQGERAPIREGETPAGSGNWPRFAVFAEGEEEFSRLAAKYPDLLELSLRKPYQTGGLWVVRPDGYVALATKTGDWDGVADYLQRIAKSG